MKSVTELLAALKREHVLRALEQLNGGVKTQFAESIKFDLVFKGKRYVPKEVIGLALENVHQRVVGPGDFKGGEQSSAFRALRRCGFTVVPKAIADQIPALSETVAEILGLQNKYSSENTEDMKRRGYLIRVELRDQLYAQVERYEPLFSASGYEFSVEGSDGIGRKGAPK